MSDRRLEPPGGDPPPLLASTDSGDRIELRPLAAEIARRYLLEFPDEEARYGAAGRAWCVHDNQYLLAWAAEAADGYLDMHGQVAWLASLLEARDYPLDRLARDLAIGADVVREQLTSAVGTPVADVLREAADYVSSHGSFRDPHNPSGTGLTPPA